MFGFIMIVKSTMQTCYFFGGFSFNESQFWLLPSAKQWIFEDEHIIILFYFVKIVHVKLNDTNITCRTNEEKLEWRKYLGKIYFVKLTTSITTNPISSLSQQIIFLFYGCWLIEQLPIRFHMFSAGKKRLYHCFCLYFYAGAISLQQIHKGMANLGLDIRIQRDSLIKLNQLQGKELVIKFNGGREVWGKLKSWDKPMNLILENTQELLGVENGIEATRVLGLIIVKGSQIQSICLKDGYEVISNPYIQAQEQAQVDPQAQAQQQHDNEEQEQQKNE